MENCKNLPAEFYEYVWAESRENVAVREAPRKEHDHAMDALRYLAMALDKEGPGVFRAESVDRAAARC